MEGELEKTINLVNKITSSKTLKSLMRTYINNIPSFFGYEQCAVMFHDNEKDVLYTITLGDDQ